MYVKFAKWYCNALLITSLFQTSLMHNDYYLKAQSWASLFSHSPLSIFHQKLVATNPNNEYSFC